MLAIDERPLSFKDMLGRASLVKEFKKRFKVGALDVPQAMLFEGFSGSGKSTTALIVAKSLNCVSPITTDGYIEPCNECVACKDVINESFMRDVVFIDCSSKSKDDVVKIEGIASSYPMYDANRVIILEEFQELSKAAKGAFLKMIEKPRKGVYFIACTMEVDKIDKAIQSRFQKYKFGAIDSNAIADYLFNTLVKKGLRESVPSEFITSGLFIIAENANNSFREAIQNMERCLMGEIFTSAEILKEFKFMTEEDQYALILRLLNKDATVISDIEVFTPEEFFYHSRKILLDSQIMRLTNYPTDTAFDAFRSRFAKKLENKAKGVKSLLLAYSEVQEVPYFNKNRFWYTLINFLDTPIEDELPKLVRPTR